MPKLISSTLINEVIISTFGEKFFTSGQPANKKGFDEYVRISILKSNEEGIVESIDDVKVVVQYFKDNFDALLAKFDLRKKNMGEAFMINAVKDALKNKPERAGYNFIRNASLYPAASTGQQYMGLFLLSCLGDTRLNVNIEDLALKVELEGIFDVLRMVESQTLRQHIQKVKPSFFDEIDKIPEWYILKDA